MMRRIRTIGKIGAVAVIVNLPRLACRTTRVNAHRGGRRPLTPIVQSDMYSLGLMIYEMLLPPMVTFQQKAKVFQQAKDGTFDKSIMNSIYKDVIARCLQVRCQLGPRQGRFQGRCQ